jgi:hypothetical protein
VFWPALERLANDDVAIRVRPVGDEARVHVVTVSERS